MESFGGHYLGLKDTPGVTVVSLNAGFPLLPSCQVISPTQPNFDGVVSVSIASEKQTVQKIKNGTRPWFSADPAYQQQINASGRGRASADQMDPGGL